MDKRSLIYIFAVSLALFVVNQYFNLEYEEKVRRWHEEHPDWVPPQEKVVTVEKEKAPTEPLSPLVEPIEKAALTNQKSDERFFVLENEYQQLLFSNIGGALVEVNLPFHDETHPNSAVREIEFDRELEASGVGNALFPSRPYSLPGSDPKGPFYEESPQKRGGYYPLLRRRFVDGITHAVTTPTPDLYALNIVSDFPEIAELVYDVKYFDKKTIVFEAIQPHRRIRKTFTLNSDEGGAPYCIDLEITLEKEKGDRRPLWLSTGVPEVEMVSGYAAPNLKYHETRLGKTEVKQIDLPKDMIRVSSTLPDWLSNSNGFFGLILDPLSSIEPGYRIEKVAGAAFPSRLVAVDQEYNRFKVDDLAGYNIFLPLRKEGGTMKFRLFAGPYAEKVLKNADAIFSDASTGYNPDYIGSQSFHGWFSFISEPFAKFLFVLMKFFHSATNSWAFSIVLLTLTLRLMLYPLNSWSFRSMQRMQQVSPLVTAIQEKHKKDPKKAQLEIMNLYKEKGVNPVMGCFPMLIQMPFLIGMFDLLKSTFELRGAPFIPGWIDNLTAPDVLFSWGYPIFFFGTEFHLLPVILGGAMYITQMMSSTLPKDRSLWTEQQQQQKMMGNVMTIVFTVMFYHFPSGLNIYWISSMLLGVVQQWFTKRQLDKSMDKIVKSGPAKKKAAKAR